MSGGFPGRVSFDDLGGVREPAGRITNPKQQVGHQYFNSIAWQVAGMNKVGDLVTLNVLANGDRESGGEAWNQKDEDAKRVAISHDTTGEYQFTCDPEYPDWAGTMQPVIFLGAMIMPRSATPICATFTRDTATQITVYLFNPTDAFAPVDADFTIRIS